LRAQRNYAGHRLAPLLGHLMVSRQYTARALLTPGEVMQLPAVQSIVLHTAHPPILPYKRRYLDDANFTQRLFPTPSPVPGRYRDAPPARPDDWTGLMVPVTRACPSESGTEQRAPDGGPALQPERLPSFEQPASHCVASDLDLLDDD